MNRLSAFVCLAAMLLCASQSSAMPTQAELDKVQPLVNELMGPLVRDYKAKKKLPVEVGDGAVSLVAEADSVAAKFVLLKGALFYYTRAKEYDKAADVVEAIISEISDVPPQTLNGIVQKAAANVTEKKAPRLVALKKAIARRAKAAASLKDVEVKLKKSPSDPVLKRMHAELVAATGDWEAALKEFTALGGAVGKIAEDEANGTAATAADFWWDYTPAALEAKDAIKEHASTLYRKALDYGELTGLKKNLAEMRSAEFSPALASTEVVPKVEYKYNYTIDNNGYIHLWGKGENEPCISPKPEGVFTLPTMIDGHKVIQLGWHAFAGCDKLTTFIFPKDVVQGFWIDPYTFRNCPKLRRVVFLGDAPGLHVPPRTASKGHNIFSFSDPDIVVEVKKGSKGWKDKDSMELPSRWPTIGYDSRLIRYIK